MSSWLSNKDYNFIYSKSTRVCVDLIIIKSGEVLLVKRDAEPYKGKWHLPGGRIRFRETIDSAIRRIAKDEIGASIRSYKFIGYMEFLREKQSGNKRHTVSLAFIVSAGETSKGKYFSKAPTNTLPGHKDFLIKNKYTR